jgi:hypothetical protein
MSNTKEEGAIGGRSYRRNETYNYTTNKSTPINIT